MNILFILFVDDANGQPCEADWEDRVNEGLDCLLFDSSHSNHDKSITFCSGKGANLIGIESEIELTKLSDIMNERRAEGRWWGGATKEGGQWKWTESREPLGPWVWGNWGTLPGEKYPNSDGTCFAFSNTAGNNGKWKGEDRKCDQQQTFTICQKKYVSINLKIRWSLVITISISI